MAASHGRTTCSSLFNAPSTPPGVYPAALADGPPGTRMRYPPVTVPETLYWRRSRCKDLKDVPLIGPCSTLHVSQFPVLRPVERPCSTSRDWEKGCATNLPCEIAPRHPMWHPTAASVRNLSTRAHPSRYTSLADRVLPLLRCSNLVLAHLVFPRCQEA